MATLVKTLSGTWKALIRKQGWPSTAKTFRTKRDAEDWSRRTEDEMVRGVYIERSASEQMTFEAAIDRYLAEVSSVKKASAQRSEKPCAEPLRAFFGKYSMAAITPDLVARYRDQRLATARDDRGKFVGWIWWVTDRPDVAEPEKEPVSGFPTSGNPTSENRTLLRKV